jgi:isopropylmalate/homocitrate/citramalate synthase
MANNPYQIRYDVLNMAKEMLDKQYDIQMEVAYKAMDMYKDNAEQALEAYKNYIPKAITPDEIKAQADKLYEFVTTKEK